MPNRFGRQFVLTSAFLWSTAGIASYALPATTSAATLAAARLLLGAAALTLFVGPRGLFEALTSLPRSVLTAASLAMAVFQWAFFAAIPGAGASVVAVASSVFAPFCADLIGVVMGRKALSWKWLLALPCATGGILLVVLSRRVSVAAMALALLSGAAYAVYTVATARLESARPAAGMAGTILSIFGAGLSLIPAAILHTQEILTLTGVGVAIYLGLVTTALAYWLFVLGLRGVTPENALVLLYAQPLATILLAACVLHETFGWLDFLGSLSIAAAALLHRTGQQVHADSRPSQQPIPLI